MRNWPAATEPRHQRRDAAFAIFAWRAVALRRRRLFKLFLPPLATCRTLRTPPALSLRFCGVDITTPIAERAVAIRRESRQRLPDAIIWATAQELGFILVTRNTRDFPSNHPGIRVPYRP